jgi:hypothetical protein
MTMHGVVLSSSGAGAALEHAGQAEVARGGHGRMQFRKRRTVMDDVGVRLSGKMRECGG